MPPRVTAVFGALGGLYGKKGRYETKQNLPRGKQATRIAPIVLPLPGPTRQPA